MSLTFLRTVRLLRQNKTSHLETKACICSSIKLFQDQDKTPDNNKEDVAKLVGTPEVPRYVEKNKMVSRAMQLYLAKRKKEDGFRQKNIQEMKLGERHLANIMGVSIDEMGPDDIKRAISYILPSGLHSRLARPSMELPIEMLVERKAESFSASGKPEHYLFYTLKPNYFQIMHDMAMVFEDIRKKQASYRDESLEPSTLQEKQQKEEFDKMVRMGIADFDKIKEGYPKESLSFADAAKFYSLLDRMVQEPLAYKRMMFFDRFPKPKSATERVVIKDDEIVLEDGKQVAYAEGGRKTIKAKVKMIYPGSGDITINNEDILFFDDIAYRQAFLFPLKFMEVFGRYDIEAEVTTSSIENQNCQASQAGAIRLAICRALVKFSTDEADVFKMERAGLLTRDPRMKERKKPGQVKARKKYTWKAR